MLRAPGSCTQRWPVGSTGRCQVPRTIQQISSPIMTIKAQPHIDIYQANFHAGLAGPAGSVTGWVSVRLSGCCVVLALCWVAQRCGSAKTSDVNAERRNVYNYAHVYVTHCVRPKTHRVRFFSATRQWSHQLTHTRVALHCVEWESTHTACVTH